MRRGMRPVTERAVRHLLARAVRSIGGRADAVVNAWPELDAFGACHERLRVFWAQDELAAGAERMGLDARRVAQGEAAQAAAADLVVAANPLVAERWRDAGGDVDLIPYGADVEAFASPPGVAPVRLPDGIRGPVVVVVGQLNERTDPAMLEAVADLDASLVLIGPVPPRANAGWLEELRRRENVVWMGAQPFDALPGLLAQADVGLVPYADTPFNQASFPLKTVEYLAAGLPVVATDLAAIRWLDAPADHLRIERTPATFAAAVADAARAGSVSPGLVDARRDFARAHSYDGRARAFIDAIDRRVAEAVSIPKGTLHDADRGITDLAARHPSHPRGVRVDDGLRRAPGAGGSAQRRPAEPRARDRHRGGRQPGAHRGPQHRGAFVRPRRPGGRRRAPERPLPSR